MLIYKELKPFLRSLINYIGHGYTLAQITTVPEKKTSIISSIDKKLSKKYELDLSRGKRQHRKRKGLANYSGLRYQNTIVILKTLGEDSFEKEKWESIYKQEIKFKKLIMVPYLDERGKISIRIGKSYLRTIRGLLELSISKKKDQEFQKVLKFLYNLHKAVRYRGTHLQISAILKDIKELQKLHGTNFYVPRFFN